MLLLDELQSYSKTKIAFGVGSFNQLGALAKSLNKSHFLIATGASAVKTGNVLKAQKIFQNLGLSCTHFGGISSDPKTEEVDKIVSLLKQSGANALVSIGGGSVIDAVKAAAVVSAQGGLAHQYLHGEKKVGSLALPHIAIPTTAGTGAELSQGAILTDLAMGLKSGIRGEALIPTVAVVDPELTLTLPRRTVAITGFDIFTHAVETYISKKATDITSKFSLQAIAAIAENLPLALKDLSRIEPRTSLSFYSMLMGYNLANSSTCLPHRLQYPLGVATKTDHAYGLAALYPSWIQVTYEASKEKFEKINNALKLGLKIDGKSDLIDTLGVFMRQIELTPRLADMGVTVDLIENMVAQVQGVLQNDPWWTEGADLRQIFIKAL